MIKTLLGKTVILPILIVFALTLSGISFAAKDRDERPFYETSFKGPGLSLHVPAYPKWDYAVFDGANSLRIELRTPKNYYPPTVMQISKDSQYSVSVENLPDLAISALNTIRSQSGVPELETQDRLISYSAGAINGYIDQYKMVHENASFDVRNIVGVFPTGRLITVLVSTPAGQIGHIEHMFDKIMVNLKEI